MRRFWRFGRNSGDPAKLDPDLEKRTVRSLLDGEDGWVSVDALYVASDDASVWVDESHELLIADQVGAVRIVHQHSGYMLYLPQNIKLKRSRSDHSLCSIIRAPVIDIVSVEPVLGDDALSQAMPQQARLGEVVGGTIVGKLAAGEQGWVRDSSVRIDTQEGLWIDATTVAFPEESDSARLQIVRELGGVSVISAEEDWLSWTVVGRDPESYIRGAYLPIVAVLGSEIA